MFDPSRGYELLPCSRAYDGITFPVTKEEAWGRSWDLVEEIGVPLAFIANGVVIWTRWPGGRLTFPADLSSN